MAKESKGHKAECISRGVRMVCECGWESEMFFGADATKKAREAHKAHAKQHEEAA